MSQFCLPLISSDPGLVYDRSLKHNLNQTLETVEVFPPVTRNRISVEQFAGAASRCVMLAGGEEDKKY